MDTFRDTLRQLHAISFYASDPEESNGVKFCDTDLAADLRHELRVQYDALAARLASQTEIAQHENARRVHAEARLAEREARWQKLLAACRTNSDLADYVHDVFDEAVWLTDSAPDDYEQEELERMLKQEANAHIAAIDVERGEPT